jgi:hypothetical protein
LNKPFLGLVFVSLLVISSLKLLKRRICNDAIFLYFLGLIMIIFNGALLLFVNDMNFVVTGFVLMLAPLIYSLNISQLSNVIISCIILVTFFSLLTAIDYIFSVSLNPINEIRYYYLSENLQSIRIQNNNLFGQKNAFGSIFALLFLLFLYLEIVTDLFKKKTKFFYLLLLTSSFMLFSSFSAGGVIIGLLGFLLWLSQKTKYGFILGTFLFLFILSLVLAASFDDQLTRKLLSASVKIGRSFAFLLLVSEDLSILFFGYNALNDVSFYTESTFFDMVLNFGLLIPLILLFFILKKLINSRNFFEIYIYFSLVFFLFTQNSAFLLPTAIIFLIIGNLQRIIYGRKQQLLDYGEDI